jgi:hypothetical protein
MIETVVIIEVVNNDEYEFWVTPLMIGWGGEIENSTQKADHNSINA